MLEFQIEELRESTISVVIDRYFQDIQQRGYSQSSITTYHTVADRFLTWCDAHQITTAQNLTEEVFADYQSHLIHETNALKGKPFKVSTCILHLYLLRRICRWMQHEQIIGVDPMEKMEISSMRSASRTR